MPPVRTFLPVLNSGSQFSLNHTAVSAQPFLKGMTGRYFRSFSAALMSNHRCMVSILTEKGLSLILMPRIQPTRSQMCARNIMKSLGSLNFDQTDTKPIATITSSKAVQNSQHPRGSECVEPSVTM
eukprot:FR736490.1.p1 GENE.FR736490.1~~FR736490.1.p1  ORF type:complete len:126 (-),score=4.52 FR736490.1:275-652(-)